MALNKILIRVHCHQTGLSVTMIRTLSLRCDSSCLSCVGVSEMAKIISQGGSACVELGTSYVQRMLYDNAQILVIQFDHVLLIKIMLEEIELPVLDQVK